MKSSLEINNEKIKAYKTDFIDIAKLVKPIFDEAKIKLNFAGYIDTIVEYLNCQETNIDILERLIGELNMWGSYMGEIKAVTESLQLSLENKKFYIQAFPKKPKYDTMIKDLSLKSYRLKLFFKHLNIQQRMFSDLSFHCSNMYNKACESLTYRYS